MQTHRSTKDILFLYPHSLHLLRVPHDLADQGVVLPTFEEHGSQQDQSESGTLPGYPGQVSVLLLPWWLFSGKRHTKSRDHSRHDKRPCEFIIYIHIYFEVLNQCSFIIYIGYILLVTLLTFIIYKSKQQDNCEQWGKPDSIIFSYQRNTEK